MELLATLEVGAGAELLLAKEKEAISLLEKCSVGTKFSTDISDRTHKTNNSLFAVTEKSRKHQHRSGRIVLRCFLFKKWKLLKKQFSQSDVRYSRS